MNPARTLSIGVALVLLACAQVPMQWVKAGATPEQVRLDLAQCSREAWREAELPPPRAAPPEAAPTVVVGPTGVPSVVFAPPSADPFEGWPEQERRYAASCMRSKGYELRRVGR
jgi:hypothetical protein